MEAKLFLDKIAYFDGSNNKEALNYLAQCGRADVVMREESRQHYGAVTWEDFQSMLIKHFYHIPSKVRAAKLLNKLQQNLHKSTEEYVQRGSESFRYTQIKQTSETFQQVSMDGT